MLVDEIPGLGLALGPGQPADVVDLTVELLDGQTITASVPLATVFALLTVKTAAWRGRRSPRDALDIWRLLEIAREQGLQPQVWPSQGAAGRARDVLIRDAVRVAKAATDTPRSQARIRALIAVHVGGDDR